MSEESDEQVIYDLGGGLGSKAEKLQMTKTMFNHAVTPLENTNAIKDSKKLIARLLTEQKSRQLAGQNAQ